MTTITEVCERCGEVHDPAPTLHISWGPSVVLKREAAGVKWCFGCRARFEHTWELMGDEQPSYYDPVWVCRCSNCDQDRTRFPG